MALARSQLESEAQLVANTLNAQKQIAQQSSEHERLSNAERAQLETNHGC